MMKRTLWIAGLMLFPAWFAAAQEGVNRDELKELLGQAYVATQDHDKAVEQYEEVLASDPENVKARTQLADVLSWEKKYDESIAEYEKVLQSRPDDIEVKKKLAAVYVWKRDYSSALVLYRELAARNPQDMKQTVALAEVLVRLEKPDEAQQLLRSVMEKDPANRDAKVLLADVYAGSKEFDKALSLYREVLDQQYDRTVKTKMADVLSWARRYKKALALYDELLSEKDEKELRLQKARILGWDRKYNKALAEYRKILGVSPDILIEKEMNAKRLYWDGRVKRAIDAYQDLLRDMPDNSEARFDLSQIFSYQFMWRQAMEQYRKILDVFANHFRAREGLKKARLMRDRPQLTSGYEFFKARSTQRETDIKRNTMANKLSIPVSERTVVDLNYDLTRRSFTDFSDLTEHRAGTAVEYRHGPDWFAGAFFDMVAYHKDVSPIYEFGEHVGFRTWDAGTMTLSHERKRLVNNSEVIRRHFYRDDFRARSDIDVTRRLKAGADYVFSLLSPSNICHEPAADVLYYFSLEPKALYVKYRYSFRDFRKIKDEYFSPQNFSTHTISGRWRHYLNREEIFFGARDIYYEAGYDLSIDSTGIVSHKVLGGLAWDITQRLQVKGEGQYTHASARVYEDKGARATLRYYF